MALVALDPWTFPDNLLPPWELVWTGGRGSLEGSRLEQQLASCPLQAALQHPQCDCPKVAAAWAVVSLC